MVMITRSIYSFYIIHQDAALLSTLEGLRGGRIYIAKKSGI